jgi:DNA-binding beta-propeller fold protein YncE
MAIEWRATAKVAAVILTAWALTQLGATSAAAQSLPSGQALPTGQTLSPTAAPGAVFTPLRAGIGPHPDYVADGAAAMSVSPDGRQLLVLTSGYNRFNGPDGTIVPEQSGQYVFVYKLDRKGAHRVQTLRVDNSFYGIAWHPDSRGFYVSGGVDDKVYVFGRAADGYALTATIALGHKAGNGADVKPQTGGLAVSPDGKHLLVANYYNDSVSLIDTASHTVIAEQDLRPGKIDPSKSGVAGGEYPLGVAWRDNSHAYVGAARDREVVALDIEGVRFEHAGVETLQVTARLPMLGEPTALLYDRAARRLYATEDNADRLAIIDGTNDKLVAEARMAFPEQMAAGDLGKGFNPNALTPLGDGRLLVTFGGINAVAVVTPSQKDAKVQGLIPTGWYPSGVAAARGFIYVANRKSPPGPNPQGCQPRVSVQRAQPEACGASNQYIYQLEKAGLLQIPAPGLKSLAALTIRVADNTGLGAQTTRAADAALMARLRARIHHVVFIIKENRTYDQVLGDLDRGNGDPRLALLGEHITPSHHALARAFVDLDNFLDSGEQSSTGWTWSTAGRTTDLLEKTAPVNYAGRGLSYEAEEAARNINTSLPSKTRRQVNPQVPDDDDILPGPLTAVAPDPEADDLPGQGFLWNAAIRAGKTVRNYGFASDFIYDDTDKSKGVPLDREAFKDKQIVYVAADRDLASRSDPYYRGFDQKFPDFWNVREWMREFDAQDAAGTVPDLSLVRISHDHFGDFKTAIDGVNTVEAEMADNDYALGTIVEHIAHSHVKDSTLIFIIEDDAQNGPDHVDARRSIAFVVGPYVKQGQVISTRYTTLSLLRTIEEILALKPMGLNDALAAPMSDVFDLDRPADWTFTAVASPVLRTTQLPIPDAAFAANANGGGVAEAACPLRSADYWETVMAGQDFRVEDHLDTEAFNAALWTGLSGAPQPVVRGGEDLRANRDALLKRADMRRICPSH